MSHIDMGLDRHVYITKTSAILSLLEVYWIVPMHLKRWIYFLFLLKISMVLVISDENPEKATDADLKSFRSSNDSENKELLKKIQDADVNLSRSSNNSESNELVKTYRNNNLKSPRSSNESEYKELLKKVQDADLNVSHSSNDSKHNELLKKNAVSNASWSSIMSDKVEYFKIFQEKDIKDFENRLKSVTVPPIKFNFTFPGYERPNTDAFQGSKVPNTDSGTENADVESEHPMPIYMYFILLPFCMALATLKYYCRLKLREMCRNCRNRTNSDDMNQLM